MACSDFDCARKVGRGKGQKTVTENLAAQNHLLPQDAIWHAIRELRAREFSLLDVCSLLVRMGVIGINDTTINSYLQRLERAGIISSRKIRSYKGVAAEELCFRLERDCGKSAPNVRRDGSPSVRGTANDRMWRSMKILKEFSYLDVQISAGMDGGVLNKNTVKSYIRFLHAAGYLVMRPRHAVNRPARYYFLSHKNTGARSPMVQRGQRVFDPNVKQVVWSK